MTTLLVNPGWQIIEEEARKRMDHCVAAVMQEDVTHEQRALLASEYRTLEHIIQLPRELKSRAETHHA